MYKKMHAIIFVLAFMVCLIPSAVFANTQTLTVSNSYSSMTVTAGAADGLADVNAAQSAATPEKELTAKLDLSYTQADKIGDYDAGRVIPITVSASGILKVDATALTLSEKIDLYVYADAACTNSLGYLDSMATVGSFASDQVVLPAAGTYYLQVSSWYSPYDTHALQQSLTMNISFYCNAGMDLASGYWYKLGGNEGDVYYKVTMPYKGYLHLYGDEELSFNLTDANRSILKDYQTFDDDHDNRCTYRLSAGTYYVKPGSYSGGSDDVYKIKYTTAKSDITMKKGSYTTIYPGDSKEVTYLKIKPTATGYIKVTIESSNVYDETCDIALCNSKKTMLTEAEWIYGRSADSNSQYYGVKKGTTYYLKVTGLGGKGKLKYTQTKISEKSGSAKKKAVTVKAKKLVKGTIVAGEKKADWYKIKLTKKKKISFYIDGKSQGQLKMTVYDKSGKKLINSIVVYGSSAYDLVDYGKYSKGTYYLKIERGSKKSNGYYTLKWK